MHTSASLLLICQCWLCVAEIYKGILKVWGKQRIIASHIKKKNCFIFDSRCHSFKNCISYFLLKRNSNGSVPLMTPCCEE